MSKIINITDKLSMERPQIQIGEKLYDVDDSMNVVLKFEELMSDETVENMVQAIEISLGKEAAEELQVRKLSFDNFKVVMTAILATMQGIEYTEAEKRFQEQQ